jgi:hypothetical protein
MRPLSAGELLDVWEGAQRASAPERALALLMAAQAESAPERVAGLSIGRRDALLLTLREWMFGAEFDCLATCPACGQRLELAFAASEIRAHTDSDPRDEWTLQTREYAVRFRLPNSHDLLSCEPGVDLDTARRLLLQRCLLHVSHGGAEVPPEQLPVEVSEAVAAQMAQVDPQADVQLSLACPQCAHRWQAAFDIGPFFWHEIDVWAQRTLREVHVLASRYGWREVDILALSAWRRRWYLNQGSP